MKELSGETVRIMASVERRMNKVVGLAETHCGRDEGLAEFDRSWDRLMRFLEREIEELARKAGVQ